MLIYWDWCDHSCVFDGIKNYTFQSPILFLRLLNIQMWSEFKLLNMTYIIKLSIEQIVSNFNIPQRKKTQLHIALILLQCQMITDDLTA